MDSSSMRRHALSRETDHTVNKFAHNLNGFYIKIPKNLVSWIPFNKPLLPEIFIFYIYEKSDRVSIFQEPPWPRHLLLK